MLIQEDNYKSFFNTLLFILYIITYIKLKENEFKSEEKKKQRISTNTSNLIETKLLNL